MLSAVFSSGWRTLSVALGPFVSIGIWEASGGTCSTGPSDLWATWISAGLSKNPMTALATHRATTASRVTTMIRFVANRLYSVS